MKRVGLVTILCLLLRSLAALPAAAGAPVAASPNPAAFAGDWPAEFAVCRPVSLKSVETAGFLGRRIAGNRAALLKATESALPRGFEARAQHRELPPEANRLAADSTTLKLIPWYARANRNDNSRWLVHLPRN